MLIGALFAENLATMHKLAQKQGGVVYVMVEGMTQEIAQ